jgi:hypothetical protein
MNTISIVDARAPLWQREINEVVKTGRNFLTILRPSEVDLDKLCCEIGCDPVDRPEHIGRWGIHALNDVLQAGDYEKLLKLQKSGDAIYFIEQLYLKHNCPPKLKEYMVYCEVRGIISDHSNLEEAKSAFFHYLESFRRARLFLMVGIYQWDQGGWVRLRSVF